MIGKLVVVKDFICACVGEVLDMRDDMVFIRVLHVAYKHPESNMPDKLTRYWALKSNIIKKSSRPVKMKQQLSLEEQQPTTL